MIDFIRVIGLLVMFFLAIWKMVDLLFPYKSFKDVANSLVFLDLLFYLMYLRTGKIDQTESEMQRELKLMKKFIDEHPISDKYLDKLANASKNLSE